MVDRPTVTSALHLSDEDFSKLKATFSSDSVHGERISSIQNQDHLASELLTGGGFGFGDFVKNAIKFVNPFHWIRTGRNIIKNTTQHKSLDDVDIINAKVASAAYKNQGERAKEINGWILDPRSTNDYAVYSKDGKHKFAIPGTQNPGDILPDLAIATGQQDHSKRFKENLRVFDKLSRGTNTADWDIVGHSLGGTQAMWIAQQRDANSHAFNPGFVSATDTETDLDYAKHNVYRVQGDVISAPMVMRDISKMNSFKVLPPASVNPLTNHGIDNFTGELPDE